MPETRNQAATLDETSSDWVSLNEATKLLGENREQVLQLGLEGVLEVKRFGRWTFVSRVTLDRRLAAKAAA